MRVDSCRWLPADSRYLKLLMMDVIWLVVRFCLMVAWRSGIGVRYHFFELMRSAASLMGLDLARGPLLFIVTGDTRNLYVRCFR